MFRRVANLFRNVVIYGMGDMATSAVSLLLLPIFTKYLTRADYGVISMLLTIEAVAKVLFRWGVDTAFMRLYYDCADQRARQRLASTIFFFLLAMNGALAGAGMLAAGWLSQLLFHTRVHAVLIELTLLNTFAAGFFFMAFQVLRIGEKSAQFVSLSFTRSAGTIVARLVLVIGAGLGVLGIVLADVVITGIMILILIPWYAPLLRPVFARDLLSEALGFGLPRVPHSIAQQIIGFADRYFLNAFATLSDVGMYSIGATFGLALKFFLGAFESAWTPFYLGLMHERDAKRVYSTVSTYVLALLVLLVTGVCVTAPAVVRIFTSARFRGAEVVTPWIALGVMFQGLNLLGAIGIVITKRTKIYPFSTGAAAAASVAANLLLIPRYGIVGAAMANAIAYLTLAVVTVGASWHFYPIRYEWNRIAKIAIAGAASYIATVRLTPGSLRPIYAVAAASVLATLVYAAVLAVAGFFRPGELQKLRALRNFPLQWKRMRVARTARMPVEMAGEFIDAPTQSEAGEVDVDAEAADHESVVDPLKS